MAMLNYSVPIIDRPAIQQDCEHKHLPYFRLFYFALALAALDTLTMMPWGWLSGSLLTGILVLFLLVRFPLTRYLNRRADRNRREIFTSLLHTPALKALIWDTQEILAACYAMLAEKNELLCYHSTRDNIYKEFMLFKDRLDAIKKKLEQQQSAVAERSEQLWDLTDDELLEWLKEHYVSFGDLRAWMELLAALIPHFLYNRLEYRYLGEGNYEVKRCRTRARFKDPMPTLTLRF